MSPETGDELPPIEHVYRPTLGEALDRWTNGTLGELSEADLGADQQEIVFVGRPLPEADDTIYVDDEGQVVYPLARKFGPGEDWHVGDIVRADLRVVPDGEGGIFLRTDMLDPRHDDIFTISDADQELVSGNGLARLDLDVEIVGRREDIVVSEYPARIRRVNDIETPWDGQREIGEGEQVLAQGEVVEYVAPSWQDHREVPGSLTLRLASGQEVTSAVHRPMGLTRGVIDVLTPVVPLAGEVIQVHLCPNDGGDRPFFDTDPPDITTPLQARKEAFLVAPDPNRLAEYRRHREAIANTMAELATLEDAEFRQTAGALIREQLEARYWPNQVSVTNLMSAKEQTALLRLMAEKFPAAADGTPNPDGMYLSNTDRIELQRFVAVSDTLGVNALAMSRREYYQFCEGLVTRAISSEPQTYVDVHPLAYLNRDFTEEQRLALLRKGCETWLPYAAGKTVARDDAATIDPATQLARHEDGVFHWILKELSVLSQTYPPALRYYQEFVEPTVGARKDYYVFGPRS